MAETNLADDLNEIRHRYATEYRLDWRDYSYRWHPRHEMSIYYRQAQERALVKLFNAQHLHLDNVSILDVGSGSGGLMRFLVSLGADPRRTFGCELLAERVKQARRGNPGLWYACGDATHMPFASSNFDLVSQFTVFSSMSIAMQRAVAGEMVRVVRPGGHILWYDMRGSFPSGPLHGIERTDLLALFAGCDIVAIDTLHSALNPRLLHRSNLLAQVADVMPFLRRTHYLALLCKACSR